ncbi:hypothetical protein EMIT091MI3_40072 [Kosakonia quasisacchari]
MLFFHQLHIDYSAAKIALSLTRQGFSVTRITDSRPLSPTENRLLRIHYRSQPFSNHSAKSLPIRARNLPS